MFRGSGVSRLPASVRDLAIPVHRDAIEPGRVDLPEAEMVNDAIDGWIEKALGADPLPMEIVEPEALPGGGLQAGQEKLTIWQPSQQFRDTTESLCSRCRSSEYFNRPQLKFLHDAYVLAEFIRLEPVESVRLASRSDQWPDGFVKLQGRVRKIEITAHTAAGSLVENTEGFPPRR
jgi:hypothetical protein